MVGRALQCEVVSTSSPKVTTGGTFSYWVRSLCQAVFFRDLRNVFKADEHMPTQYQHRKEGAVFVGVSQRRRGRDGGALCRTLSQDAFGTFIVTFSVSTGK